jgi:homoaconitate hydratase
MAQNLTEKIAQSFAVGLSKGQTVHSGDYINIRPAHVLTHDNTGAVMNKFKAIGASKIAFPRQPVFTLDHNVQDKSVANLAKYESIEEFAKTMGVDFYPAGRGIGHQIMVEEGYAFPGEMAVASDSHANMYGGIGCLGTPVVRTDAAALWASGQTWWQIPPVAKVSLQGKLTKGVSGKDIIITLAGLFNKDEVLNHAIEISGSGVEHLSINERLTIANMTTEWGALTGLFPIDEIVLKWLRQRIAFVKSRGLSGMPSDLDGKGENPRLNLQRFIDLEKNLLVADEKAFYSEELTLDLTTVRPHVSGPGHVKTMTAVSEIEERKVKIQKAYLVSCVNSRVDDLAEAAAVVKGKKVAEHVEFYIAAASDEVQSESKKKGDWNDLLEAGAIPLLSGCGPCIGLGMGLLEPGETGISATNRNFKGRMGSPDAETYLASPAVVAASAVAGKIVGPTVFGSVNPIGNITVNEISKPQNEEVKLLSGFPESIGGELVFCPQDNLNTDGIFPGKYTYIDDFTLKQQAAVVMENYDTKFRSVIKNGDILAGGFNFGTGSSREQAATALQASGIQLVLAGSFSQTFKRNAINNGFLVIEAPELILDLVRQFGRENLTIRTNYHVSVNFKKSELSSNGKTVRISPIGQAAQDLILSGGLENWVKKRL